MIKSCFNAEDDLVHLEMAFPEKDAVGDKFWIRRAFLMAFHKEPLPHVDEMIQQYNHHDDDHGGWLEEEGY
jgi:hypothetical protein